jgi:hypothetical protein
VDGDIAAVVGGARDESEKSGSTKPDSRTGGAGPSGDVLTGLRAAKERARQRIADAEGGGSEPRT